MDTERSQALLDALRADPRYVGEGEGTRPAPDGVAPFVWIKFRDLGRVEAEGWDELARKAARLYDVRTPE